MISSLKFFLSFKHGACVRIRTCRSAESECEEELFLSSVSVQQLLLSCGRKRGLHYCVPCPPGRGFLRVLSSLIAASFCLCRAAKPTQAARWAIACCETHVAASSVVVPRRMMLLCSLLDCSFGYTALPCMSVAVACMRLVGEGGWVPSAVCVDCAAAGAGAPTSAVLCSAVHQPQPAAAALPRKVVTHATAHRNFDCFQVFGVHRTGCIFQRFFLNHNRLH